MLTRRRLTQLPLIALPLLAACGRDDAQAALEATVKQLQARLEARDTRGVMQLLHPRFRAQQGEFDPEWARRTMALVFLRHAQIRVIALSNRSQIDPAAPRTGRTEAQVLVTGAQGLIPDEARPYRLSLRWQREGDDWLLADLDWE